MRRQSISASEYAVILGELVVTSMHASIMSVIIGTHEAHGRVILLRSGTGFVIIADRLEVLRRSYDKNHLLQAVAQQAEAAKGQDRNLQGRLSRSA
ncbi:hypothetical protein P7D22_13395 [Lichenihabitans sp. Uapishka_5]|uniref:hypothetical protein n=1 Tax=Lichenihabitans sp. Uapishka_5 TaxID=3037302 RepID=UPI0029E7CC91|nr:hypothetical protein [Lichenihabitans sp. Uapishka_5]MDX7952170.1 hypothetical protein [Lichenihabitans sp. Uapishka_5]